MAGALETFHRQGVQATTIAEIAKASDVPVGNVYYYFKTKDELVTAVIDAHAQTARATLASLEHHRTPKDRLKAFVRLLMDQSDLTARYGCPQGTLCSELDKQADGLDRACAELMRLPIDWTEQQFKAIGRPDARDLAVALIALPRNRATHQHPTRPRTHEPRGKTPRGRIESLTPA